MPKPPIGFCASSSPSLTVVSESRVTWATSVPILVFLGLSVLDLVRCTRQTDVRRYCTGIQSVGELKRRLMV